MTAPLESAASAEGPRPAVVTPSGNGTSRRPTMPTARGGMPRALILLFGAAASVITVAGMMATAWLIGPVFLALIIVIAAHPVQRWLRARGWPIWAASLALLLVVYVGLLALALILAVSVGQLATTLPQYSAQFDALIASVQHTLAGFGIGPTQIQQATQSVSLSSVAGAVGGIVSGVSGTATVIVLILALLLFFIADAATFGKRLESIAAERPHIVSALESFASGTRNYLVVTTVFGFIVAVLDGIALGILGVPLAVLWAVLAFITNYIPNIGFIFGLVPPALLALLTGGWQLLVIVVVVYCVLNLVIQSLIQPRFIGNSVGLSATVTFVTLLFWAWVLGALGALLAIPLTLLAKALLVDIDPQARWADALLRTDAEDPAISAPEPEPEPDPDLDPDPEATTVDEATAGAPGQHRALS
ncbi:AI-2E family transporter [Actinomycetospora endophytica]|uniref:AI-2E family transporter n=1 Tax=Actinomycetospora endophytica TaxID=2291215 RepID=A0ABS8PAZ1_9PSEU|nr:AI-2E family transporter [Actinomycetospora endophytica]MCD2195419.1 AI-2E family transporter [Actinomycetospora endophytica]